MRHFTAIFLVTCLPIAGFAQDTSDDDKGYLTNLIEENLSGDGRTVSIIGFEGAFSSEARIAQILISDAEGVWLTLDDVVMTWSRSALLRGRIDVEKLAAAKISLVRVPASESSGPAPEATPFSLPELPVSLDLGALNIARIELGEAILGQPLAFSLTGDASLASGALDAQITANRLDAKAGLFDVGLGYSNADRVLDLNLSIAEDANGLASTLLDLPGNPSVALSLQGDAPLDDFAASLTIGTDGVTRVEGDIGIAAIEGGTGFSIDIAGDVTSLFLPEYQEFFGPLVQLKANGAQLAAGGFGLNDLDLTAQSLRLTGSAAIDANGLPSQISLSGNVQDPDGDIVLLPLAGEKTYVDRMDLNVGYNRAQSDDWTGDFNIAGLDRPGMLIREISLSGGGVISDATLSEVTANMRYAASGLVLDDAALAEAVGTEIDGDFALDWRSGEPTRISRLALQGAGLSLLADATIAGPQDGLNTTVSALLDTESIARFSTLAGRPLDGAAQLVLLGEVAPLNGTFDAILTGDTTDLMVDIAQLDPYLRGAGKVSVQAIRDNAGTRLPALQVTTNMVDISASADLTSDGSTASLMAALTDVAPILEGVSGPATVQGDVAQRGDGTIAFDVDGTLPDVSFAAKGDAVQGDDAFIVNFDTTASITDLARYNNVTGQALSGAASLTASGVAQTDGQGFDVTLDGTTQDMQTGIAQLDPLLRGTGLLRGEIARLGADDFRLADVTITTPAITITANGAGGVMGEGVLDATISMGDATVLDPALNGPLDLSLNAVRGADERANIDLIATAPATEVTLKANVAPADEDFAIDGDVALTFGDLSRYRSLIGQPLSGGVTATVTGSLLPDLSVFDVAVDATTRQLAIGNAAVDTLTAGTGTISLTADQADGALSVPKLDIVFNNITASGALDGQDATGQGQFQMRLRDIGLFTDTLSGPVTANGTAQRRSNSWGIDAAATGPGGITATANGTYNDNGQVAIDVDGAAPLGLANEVISPRRASGDVRFDMAINGPPALSSVSGVVSLADGQITDPSLSQTLRDLGGTIRLIAGRAQIALDGALDSGGTVSVDGPVAMSAPYQADITARLNAITLQDPTLYETSVDGTITLSGPLAGGAAVGGVLTLGQTELQVPSSGIGALGDLPDVTHIGASNAVRTTLTRADALVSAAAEVATSSSGPVYPIDLQINAPSRIFVRGRGLDAELGGSLTLGGTSANIIPLGQFSLVRGRLDILQQRFDLTEGTATLQGDFTPFLRLVARTETDTGTTVSIIVEGPATAPVVTFASEPELPQDEVLAQLIFGRDLADISPLQAVQLAAAVGTLAGRGGGGLIDTLRQNVGLDDFDISTDDDGNAAVRAGKYISENVYTDITVNSQGDTDITINLDVTDTLTAKGTLGTDGETSIGLFYERDY